MSANRRWFLMRFGLAVAAVALAALVRDALDTPLAGHSPYLLFVLPVMLAGWYGGLGPALLATALGAVCGAAFFARPTGFFKPLAGYQQLQLLLFLLAGGLISTLTQMLHRAFWQLRLRSREAQRQQRAIRDVEERFRLLVEGLKDYAISILDSDGRIVGWNAGAERLEGYAPDDILGQDYARFFTAEDVAAGRPRQVLEEAAREGRTEFDAPRVRKDGSRFLAHVVVTALRDEGGRLRGFAKLTQDITEREKAAAALQLTETRLASIIEAASDAIVTVDPEHRIIAWNRAAERMFACPAAQAMGQRIERFIPELAAAANDHGEAIGVDLHGRHFPLEATLSETESAEGRISTIFIRDVTERKRSEQELRTKHEQLQAVSDELRQANAAKDRFLAVLSHELRTPLTPVLATVTSLEEDPSVPEAIRHDLRMMRRNVELESRLIDDLLDLTRISRGKMHLDFQPVALHELVRNSAEAFAEREALDKQIALSLELHAHRDHVQGDPARLQQVIWNLLRNAVKFTPPGGSVRVVTRAQGERLRLEVIDTGIGIEPRALVRIFDAFEQGDEAVRRRFGGLGLGLAISRALVEALGGTLVAHSDGPGRGATFALELPLLPVPAEGEKCPLAPAAPAPVPQPLRILLVEDHEDTARIMRRLLEGMGHRVDHAASVADAIALAERETFDLLVSDLGLPDGRGTQIMRQLRERGVPGVALSGYGMETDIRQSLEAGFREHLTKPVDFGRLHEAIARAVSGPAEESDAAVR